MGFESFPQPTPKSEQEKKRGGLSDEERDKIFIDVRASEERRARSGKPLSSERADLFSRFSEKLRGKAAAYAAAFALAGAGVAYGISQYESGDTEKVDGGQTAEQVVKDLQQQDAQSGLESEAPEQKWRRHFGAMSDSQPEEVRLYHLEQAKAAANDMVAIEKADGDNALLAIRSYERMHDLERKMKGVTE